jgi:cell division protein FtsQ
VEGAHRTGAGKVLDAAGLKPGVRLFAVDVQQVRRSMEKLPWVRHARVVRQVPSTLTLIVEEWNPAYLVRFDRLYYLTREGHVVRAPVDQGLDFPVVTGLSALSLESPGPTREAVLELFDRVDKYLSPLDVSEIHFDQGVGITVYNGSDPGQGIFLGFGNLDEKFNRLARLRRQLEKKGQTARAVNLSYEDKVIARLIPAGGEGPKL